MATKIDFYAVLEVTRTATADELKKAYRKQAMRYHPTATRVMRAQSINSRKSMRPMTS